MQKLIKYGIITESYNIYTNYDELSDDNKMNIKLYNNLSYIKVDDKIKVDGKKIHALSIDNILFLGGSPVVSVSRTISRIFLSFFDIS